MFGVKHNECVGFESRWRVKKVSSVGASQTTEYETTEMETNTSNQISVEVQTEPTPQTSASEVDEEKLAEWLKRIYPSVKRELDDSTNSRAFKGYQLANDSTDANCKLVQTVTVEKEIKDPLSRPHISALSWNCTNKTLGVSSSFKHNSWCTHEGIVRFYTLDHDDNLPEEARLKLKTDSCVTDIEFHSALPAVVAAGLFSGGIVVWNIQKEEEQIVAKIDGHGDGVTQLSWIADINSPKNVLLALSSLDGYLSLWDFSVSEMAVTLKERHQIRSQLLPKASDSSPEEVIKKVIRGVTCFNFSKHAPEMFLVGAEGGLVIQCSLLGTRKLPGNTMSAPLLDSVFKYYQPHKGEVNCVSFSPNRKDMFMTSGSDQEIRIYMIGQEEPAKVIFLKQALNCVRWVPYEERIICGCGNNGIIEIFQLVRGKAIENTTKDKIKKEVLTQIQVNKMKSNIVAVGTETGNVQMWRVPWTLFGNMAA